MKRFSDFNIQPLKRKFLGSKIKVSRILGKEISVDDYKIEDSKIFKDEQRGGKCLHLQITLGGEKRVVFTGAAGLINSIQQIPKNELPFTTKIIEVEERYEFS